MLNLILIAKFFYLSTLRNTKFGANYILSKLFYREKLKNKPLNLKIYINFYQNFADETRFRATGAGFSFLKTYEKAAH